METISEWKDLATESISTMAGNIGAALPSIVGAILILLVGWLITKVVLLVLKKLLKIAKVDRLTEKINETDLFGRHDIDFKASKVILSFAKWLMFLVFLIVAADILNWNIISSEIGNLLRYLPKLFSAIALFMIGLYIANFMKKAIKGVFESFELSGSKIISNIVFYLILVFITVTALNQAGVDTTIITNNVTIILGSFLLALSIGFGLGSKEVIADLLRTFYTRKTYMLGDKINVNGVKGTIESIDNISITLKTNNGLTIIPIKELVDNRVEIEK
ncbi:mechanosensitive ion channel domain-containing protein [Maribacter algicola]|uniref:Mechanosensitive ion channel domain-containing protein n=1 Tax=Meishania litoralis TaxID=3434685 RepID=A0ACC7LNC9_9FLAO